MKQTLKKSLALFLAVWMFCLVGITAHAASEEPIVVPTAVKINHETLSMNYGGTAQLNATVLPAGADQAVGWSSSNPTLVSVDSYGNLTAAKDTADSPTGKQTVTITCASMKYPSIRATCTVTVDNDMGTKLKAYLKTFVALFTSLSTALAGPAAQIGSTLLELIKKLFASAGTTTAAAK